MADAGQPNLRESTETGVKVQKKLKGPGTPTHNRSNGVTRHIDASVVGHLSCSVPAGSSLGGDN